MIDASKGVALEAVKLTAGKVGHIIGHLAKTATVTGGCKRLIELEPAAGVEPATF